MRYFLAIMVLLETLLGETTDTYQTYETCIQSARTQSQALYCIGNEIARQDRRLNKNYKAAMKRIEPFRREDLKRIQKLWIRYRDAKCGFFTHPHSGSGGTVDTAECILEETRRRADELEKIY